MHRIRRLFAGLLVIPTIAPLSGGSAISLVDGTSLLLVLSVSLLFTPAGHGPRTTLQAIGAALSAEPPQQPLVEAHGRVLDSLRSSLRASGAVGFILGIILVLQDLGDPSAIGPAVAISLLTLFYALLLAELCVAPLASGLHARAAAGSPADP